MWCENKRDSRKKKKKKKKYIHKKKLKNFIIVWRDLQNILYEEWIMENSNFRNLTIQPYVTHLREITYEIR